MFETMVNSIQTDEARHAQIGHPVLDTVIRHDPAYAQYLLDKWFWRSWQLFAILTGFCMDYLTPLEQRPYAFKEFMEEWILDQYLHHLEAFGMQKPWYWDLFLDSLDIYHHCVMRHRRSSTTAAGTSSARSPVAGSSRKNRSGMRPIRM